MKYLLKKNINTALGLFNLELKRKSRWNIPSMPIEANEFEKNLISECSRFSMIGNIRMWALIQSMKYIINNNINGDFVECGVWRGGNLALMRKFSDYHKLKVSIFGYDTFEGMPDATIKDVDLHGNLASQALKHFEKNENTQNIHAYAGIVQVKKNLQKLNAENGVKLIEGMVENTLTKNENLPDKISILRLDTDFYESTKIELEILFPRLATGGVLIIDDYGHFKGAQQAVDEYFEDKDIWLHYVDYTCRLMIKN